MIAMLCGLSYAAMFFSRSLPPLVAMPPLKYDPKDIFIIIGGFFYGPFVTVGMSVIVSLIEMITVSTTGPYGLLMNIVSTCAFVFPATAIYKKFKSLKGAVCGLGFGVVFMAAVMMLWNYIITPLYIKAPREIVAGMLIPVFLPFNLLKGSLNAAVTMAVYKPLSKALRKAGMLPSSGGGGASAGVIIVSVFAVATCILLMLVFAGVI
jgi:riboflavin transporter FmnP